MLLFGIFAVMLGFGLFFAYGWLLVDLWVSLLLVPMAHALVGILFVVCMVLFVVWVFDFCLVEVVVILGSSCWWVWCIVELLLVRCSIVVGVGFAVVVFLGEFGVISFLVCWVIIMVLVVIVDLFGWLGVVNVG